MGIFRIIDGFSSQEEVEEQVKERNEEINGRAGGGSQIDAAGIEIQEAAKRFKNFSNETVQKIKTSVNERFIDGIFETPYELPQEKSFFIQKTATVAGNVSASRKPALPFTIRLNFDPLISESSIKKTTGKPTIILPVNPNELNREFAKKVTPQLTRNGWVTEHWGDELTNISLSGTSGAFYVTTEGITRVNRNESRNYQEFMRLYSLFKKNGYTHSPQITTNREEPSDRISTVGTVEIIYNNELLLGTFETFSFEEVADNPFVLTYNISMKIENIFKLQSAAVDSDTDLTGGVFSDAVKRGDFTEISSSEVLARAIIGS